jgi:hypothetical protein
MKDSFHPVRILVPVSLVGWVRIRPEKLGHAPTGEPSFAPATSLDL